MAKSPRRVEFPTVGDEAIAEFIRHVHEGVLAGPADVHGDIGDEGVVVGVLRAKRVSAEQPVGPQVEHENGVGTHLAGGIAYANRTHIQDPQTIACVGLENANATRMTADQDPHLNTTHSKRKPRLEKF